MSVMGAKGLRGPLETINDVLGYYHLANKVWASEDESLTLKPRKKPIKLSNSPVTENTTQLSNSPVTKNTTE
ncbi:unnamed protein product [Timema podura]|uniref:Uncharacterized protein n=1 Tax=Timema podura TaxID=61482 RepID=A0ABN7PD30_TIMPD|nr:unnamed protein product [Timema podura]